MSKKKKKKSIFTACFPCFSTAPIDCHELTCSAYVGKVTEFEYIVENMSIYKVPKKFLRDNLDKDFSGYVVKGVPPETSIGPVVTVEDASFEVTSSGNLQVDEKPYRPVLAAPICMTCESVYSPLATDTFQARTELDDDTVQDLLTPVTALKQNQSKKRKVLADIHKTIEAEGINVPTIPPEIKETIDALRVARPLHINSKFSPRNHRSLIRSHSNTSCDKETLCHLLDDKCIEVEELQQKVNRWYAAPIDKVDASSSTSDFPDTPEYNKNTSSDLQSSGKVEAIDLPQAQSLKWKIIINKHKGDVNV